jgi:hypothetical protein
LHHEQIPSHRHSTDCVSLYVCTKFEDPSLYSANASPLLRRGGQMNFRVQNIDYCPGENLQLRHFVQGSRVRVNIRVQSLCTFQAGLHHTYVITGHSRKFRKDPILKKSGNYRDRRICGISLSWKSPDQYYTDRQDGQAQSPSPAKLFYDSKICGPAARGSSLNKVLLHKYVLT